MKPSLTLKIDARADSDNAIAFLKHNASDGQMLRWFFPEELHYMLDGTFSAKEQQKIVAAYSKSIYALRKKEIKTCFNQVLLDWRDVEDEYLSLVDRIFQKHPWPKGRYAGYVSIFNMYPRNIEAKTFFFPYIHSIPKKHNEVIAHEMLHFMFFSYIQKMYGIGEDFRFKGRSKEYVWEVSEVFNNVIEDWGPYQAVVTSKPFLYHGKIAMFNTMKKQWNEKQDVKWLLDQWLLPTL